MMGLYTPEAYETGCPIPLLVKIAPDLSDGEIDDAAGAALAAGIDGIIATNTTTSRVGIPARYADVTGGLSGAPLREKSTALVRAITARSTIPVVASGGIFDAESAREKFEAGAQLLQLYTGYIYRGPGLLREISESLS